MSALLWEVLREDHASRCGRLSTSLPDMAQPLVVRWQSANMGCMATNDPFDLRVEDMIALARGYPIRELSLFGSVLGPNFRRDSDVDVLVEFEQDAAVGLFEFVRLQDELSALIGREVDLVEKRALKRFIRDEVMRSRGVLYAAT